jgi:TolB protein
LSVMDANGLGRTRINRGAGDYGFPSWSPRGDLIAFIKEEGGRTYLGIMRPDGGAERLLAQGVALSPPSWSPNGELLLFAKPDGSLSKAKKLYTINITGYAERQVPTPAYATETAWTPINP